MIGTCTASRAYHVTFFLTFFLAVPGKDVKGNSIYLM